MRSEWYTLSGMYYWQRGTSFMGITWEILYFIGSWILNFSSSVKLEMHQDLAFNFPNYLFCSSQKAFSKLPTLEIFSSDSHLLQNMNPRRSTSLSILSYKILIIPKECATIQIEQNCCHKLPTLMNIGTWFLRGLKYLTRSLSVRKIFYIDLEFKFHHKLHP